MTPIIEKLFLFHISKIEYKYIKKMPIGYKKITLVQSDLNLLEYK